MEAVESRSRGLWKQRPLEAEDLDGLFESKKYLNFLLLYKYMKIWYFHRQYNVFWEPIKSYNIFGLHEVSKVAAHFQKKNKMFIYSFKYPNKEGGKILPNKAAESLI